MISSAALSWGFRRIPQGLESDCLIRSMRRTRPKCNTLARRWWVVFLLVTTVYGTQKDRRWESDLSWTGWALLFRASLVC
ncbi:uncharacterized protein BO80DRAFT_44909 [Aspergillus ibericus CBS 121593]|uniref:Uncharacterized protein n=1 Tax=Aspergillus ibericus CBS 121593 TaxID=1448316 RepID=A0A395H261_9EURO|nr:hypothetical protein BO80DRAFT_44909 [Aspergillus ibericus CBS 121593]RAL01856.1 hypothetical protein BO80DRAFT_44909 [Aspergillus ibericus CBS 121593]